MNPSGSFNYPTPYRIGAGRIAELPDWCREQGMKRPLVVTDRGIAALEWFDRLVDQLRESFGHELGVFSGVSGNPTEPEVDMGATTYEAGDHDSLILVGGGSAIDVGKCIALLAEHRGPIWEYEDIGDNWKKIDSAKVPPMIAVPTTAGTGSEVGRASVITDPTNHTKRLIFHPRMLPTGVLADPELTVGLPPAVTAATGVDAFVHAFEAYCAPAYHPMADGIALEAMRLCKEHLGTAFADGSNLEARTHMLMAASMGATAFQKGLGLVHALAHPLGAHTGIHHGLANAILLPYCMLHNRDALADKMPRLARHLGVGEGFDEVLAWVLEWRRALEIPPDLSQQPGMANLDTKIIATDALQDASLGTNPRAVSLEGAEGVLRAALHGDGLGH